MTEATGPQVGRCSGDKHLAEEETTGPQASILS